METMYEPVNMGYVPSMEIEQALATRDEGRIWRASNAGITTEDFYETLKTHTFNKTVTRYRGHAAASTAKSALILVPMIVQSPDMNDVKVSETTARAIATSIQKWSGFRSSTCLLQNVFDYLYVASKEPITLRQMLDQMVDHESLSSGSYQESDAFRFQATLPADAPTLRFLLGASTGLNEWPTIPQSHHNHASTFTKSLKSTLCFDLFQREAELESFELGMPDFADQALEAGLKMWLNALQTRYGIGRWNVAPRGGDRVDIYFELTGSSDQPVCIPIRTYQIGVKGVERVIKRLAELGTQMEASEHH